MYKRAAGVESTLASQVVSLSAGTMHTVNVTASGTSLTATVDGGTHLTATSNFNQSVTTHGWELKAAANLVVDNFQVTQ